MVLPALSRPSKRIEYSSASDSVITFARDQAVQTFLTRSIQVKGFGQVIHAYGLTCCSVAPASDILRGAYLSKAVLTEERQRGKPHRLRIKPALHWLQQGSGLAPAVTLLIYS